jgi:hypothetical protein
MDRPRRIASALAVVAGLLFAYVAIHEFGYASAHPYAYGPAKLIGLVCIAGALLAGAVAVATWSTARSAT